MILFTGSGALANACSQVFEVVTTSLRSISDEKLRDLLCNCDVVMHNSAAIQSDSLAKYVESNFMLTKRLVDVVCSVNPNVMLINIGSMSYLQRDNVYDAVNNMINYAYSKFLGETYLLKSPLKNVCSVRFSTVFYKNAARDGLSKLGYDAVKSNEIKLINQGCAKRDFIPIDVVAAYLSKLADCYNLPKTINIASGKSFSFKHFSNIIQQVFPSTTIVNSANPHSEVLHQFDVEPLRQIGIVDFDITSEFEKYLHQVDEDADLQ